jgi:hypothetical protein
MQQSLREDAPEVRERKPSAVGASRAAIFSYAWILRSLGVATLISLFLSLIGAFGAGRLPFLERTAIMTVYGWAGCLIGIGCFRLVSRFLGGSVWLRAAPSSLLMVLPMGLFVWAAASIQMGMPLPASALPSLVWQTLIMCVSMTFLAVAMSQRSTPAAEAAPAAPKFLERIPLKLRGGELWAVEAEDHYLRLHTSKGQDLILMRLADAVDELDGIEGAQVHRSWWVAREAIADARRGDGRATLTLKDGSEVPVSRTYARVLRDRSWI